MVVLEGQVSVLAALRAQQRRIQVILVRRGQHAPRVAEVTALAAQRGVPIRQVEPVELNRLARGATHGGILAVCTARRRTSPAELLRMVQRLREPPFLLLLEGIDDARNLGFALRSAYAFGAHAVLIKKHLWDFDEAEVARPASGAFEFLPLVQLESVSLLKQLQSAGLQLLGCLGGARRSIWDASLTGPSIVAVGGEKRGLSGAVRGLSDEFVRIPTRAGGPSLALSHAAAIAAAAVYRQRQDVGRPCSQALSDDTGR